MTLGINQVGSLLGGVSDQKNANVYDLLSGTKNVNEAILGGLISSGQNLSKQQLVNEDILVGLEDFVKQNISGKDADKLYASINGLRQLLNNQETDADLDPAFSLLASSPFSKQSGSLIDLFT